MEVGKLCRVIADFPNTVYLLAYDREYVNSVIVKQLEGNFKGNSFFDKIVQLEFRIPQTTEGAIYASIWKILMNNIKFIKRFDNEFSVEKLRVSLDRVHTTILLSHFVLTLRDVKRFCNGFLLKYSSLSQFHKIDFGRIFLLELIFYKYKNVYDLFYASRSEAIESLINGHMPENIFPVESKLIKLSMRKVVEGLNPIEQQSLFNVYFSYYDLKGFSRIDIEYVYNVDTSLLHQSISSYVEQGYVVEILLGIVKKLADLNASVVYSLVEQDGKYEILLAIEAYFIKGIVKLEEDQFYTINNELIDAWTQLEERKKYRQKDDYPSIDRLRKRIYEFKYRFPVFNSNSPKQITLTSQKYKYHSLKKDDDDSTYNEVFDISLNKYEFYFDTPNVEHWRIGFKFSTNQIFPVFSTQRLVAEFPLYHIQRSKGSEPTRDSENILATYYNERNIEMPQHSAVKNVKGRLESSIKLTIYKEKGSIKIIIRNGYTDIPVEFNDLQNFNFVKLYAWADNEEVNNGIPYEFRVEILKRTSN